MDRSLEFSATVDSVKQQFGGGPSFTDPLLGSPNLGKRPILIAQTELLQRALRLNTGILEVSHRLDKLSKLTRTKSLFDDRPAEVQELTDLIKRDLASLNRQIADLQTFSKVAASRPTSPSAAFPSNRQSEEHASIVVMSLQSRLAAASSTFTRVLDERQQSIKAQNDRREHFSATNILSVMPQQPPSTSQLVNRQPSPRPPGGHVAIELPSESGGKQQQQLALMQQSDTAYLTNRSNALSTIEATITELGLIYQQLAHMVSEQGEMVQRIDANIEDVHANVMRGQDQLLRYLRGVSSNRWLLVKIFSVMIVFAFVFIVFFA